MSDQVQYNTYYSLYMLQNVNMYLSWTSFPIYWAYLYDTPKALWFDKVNGSNSGPVLTGDVLQVVIHVFTQGRGAFLNCRGLSDWTIQWTAPGVTSQWSFWTDSAMTKGQPINVGDTVFLTSQDPSYAGNYLIQYLPNYPQYLTAGPSTVPYQFQIRTESGGTSIAADHAGRAAPPPDTQKP